MEPCQPTDGEEHQGYDAHDHHGHNGGHLCELLLVMKHMNQAQDKDTNHVEAEGDQKHEEVSVISPANTVVNPWAVVVKDLNTVVTDTAVTAPGWSVELAGHAPLHTNRDSIDLNIPVERGSEIIISVLIRTCSGYDTRVHEGCHGEVDEDKKRDDPLEDWDRVPLLLQNVPLDTREIEEKCGGSQKQHPRKCCW